MFSAKINWLLVVSILLLDLRVCHFQTAPNGACKKPNGIMQSNLNTRDDIEIHPDYESHCLIKSFEEADKLRCLTACNMDCLCYMLTHAGSTCNLYNQSAVNYFIPKSSNDKKVYVKQDQTINGLTHHWSMNGSGIDLVRRHDLEILENGVYAEDRNGQANSSIHFSNGSALVPPGVYFDPATGGFTVMAWLKLSSLEDAMRIIDFGTTEGSYTGDNIIVLLGNNNNLRMFISNNGAITFDNSANNNLLVKNTWFHFAVSVSNTLSKVTVYFDGANEVSSTIRAESYRAVERTICRVGKSTESNSYLFNGHMDDLKIFNRALTAEEVKYQMKL